MTRASAVAAALALAACRHPSKVGQQPEPPERKAESNASQKGVPRRGEHPPVPATPKALLAEGEIAKIQQALEVRGYLAKERRAGALDDATTKALRKFQQDEQLAETGFPDRLTLQKLGIDPEHAYSKTREAPQGGVTAEDEGEKKR